MGRLRSKIVIVSSLLLVTVTGSYADDHDAVKQLYEKGEIISAETLLKDALQRKPGRLLELELEVEDGRRVYEVEIIDDHGVVWEYFYDARTGIFLRQAIEGEGSKD